MYHFRDTSSQSVLKNFSYCLFSSVHFHLLFINQCPLIFIVYPPMFLFFSLFVHNCLFLFWLLPMSFPFVYFLSIKVSFLLLLFIHQCLFWFWLFTNVFILDLLFIHQCLLLDVVYPLLFLSVLVVHQFLHLLFCLSTCPMSSFGFVDPPMSLGFSCSPMSPFCYCMSTNVSF